MRLPLVSPLTCRIAGRTAASVHRNAKPYFKTVTVRVTQDFFFFFFFQDSNCHSGRTSSLVLMTGAAISGQDLSLFYGRDETFLDVIEMYSNRPVARYLRLLLRLRLCSLFSIYRGDNRQGYNRGKRKRSVTSKSLHSRFWTHSSATMC